MSSFNIENATLTHNVYFDLDSTFKDNKLLWFAHIFHKLRVNDRDRRGYTRTINKHYCVMLVFNLDLFSSSIGVDLFPLWMRVITLLIRSCRLPNPCILFGPNSILTFIPCFSNIIFYRLTGGAEFFPGPARGERGGQEETGGSHSQSHTAGGGSDWSHSEGPSEGNWAGQVSSGRSRSQIHWFAGFVICTCTSNNMNTDWSANWHERIHCDVWYNLWLTLFNPFLVSKTEWRNLQQRRRHLILISRMRKMRRNSTR